MLLTAAALSIEEEEGVSEVAARGRTIVGVRCLGIVLEEATG